MTDRCVFEGNGMKDGHPGGEEKGDEYSYRQGGNPLDFFIPYPLVKPNHHTC